MSRVSAGQPRRKQWLRPGESSAGVGALWAPGPGGVSAAECGAQQGVQCRCPGGSAAHERAAGLGAPQNKARRGRSPAPSVLARGHRPALSGLQGPSHNLRVCSWRLVQLNQGWFGAQKAVLLLKTQSGPLQHGPRWAFPGRITQPWPWGWARARILCLWAQKRAPPPPAGQSQGCAGGGSEGGGQWGVLGCGRWVGWCVDSLWSGVSSRVGPRTCPTLSMLYNARNRY